MLLLILTHICNILLIRALFSSGQDSIITAHIKGSFTLKERGVEYKIDIAVRWVLSKFNMLGFHVERRQRSKEISSSRGMKLTLNK